LISSILLSWNSYIHAGNRKSKSVDAGRQNQPGPVAGCIRGRSGQKNIYINIDKPENNLITPL